MRCEVALPSMDLGAGTIVDACKSLFSLSINKNFRPNPETSSRSLVMVNPPSARPGHLVYCFGDVDSRYCRGLSGSAGSDYIMKQIWLEFNG